MTRICRFAVSPLLAVAVCAASLPATAQQFSTQHPVASSVIVTSMASAVVITAPIWLLSAGVSKASDGSARRSRARAEAKKAGPLPPLTVEKVERTAEGGVQIALQNPQAPDEPAVLAWPAPAQSPVDTVKVGDVLAFTPTPGGAGWNVANAEGITLAFLPTDPDSAQPSTRW
ncbi:hypothetical protein [Stenotrophomonas sp.]|uniref:hypothetical protein n=1 Tax=Stenotrophomonas sp. TaxID=69392 RepID=UPI002FCB6404